MQIRFLLFSVALLGTSQGSGKRIGEIELLRLGHNTQPTGCCATPLRGLSNYHKIQSKPGAFCEPKQDEPEQPTGIVLAGESYWDDSTDNWQLSIR